MRELANSGIRGEAGIEHRILIYQDVSPHVSTQWFLHTHGEATKVQLETVKHIKKALWFETANMRKGREKGRDKAGRKIWPTITVNGQGKK